jgi:hypothetical protein
MIDELKVVVSGNLETDWGAIILQVLIPSITAFAAAWAASFWTLRLQSAQRCSAARLALIAEISWLQIFLKSLSDDADGRTEIVGSKLSSINSAYPVYVGLASSPDFFGRSYVQHVVNFYGALLCAVEDAKSAGAVPIGTLERLLALAMKSLHALEQDR